MKKTLLSLIAGVALLSLSVHAQSPPPPAATNLNSTITDTYNTVLDFIVNGSNWLLTPFGIMAQQSGKTLYGGGVALSYKVSEYVLPTLRLDYLDGDLWMPSGTVQLQLPIHLSSKITLYPFAFGGVGTPLSGGGTKNGEANAIAGMGLALKLSTKVSLVGDYEKWSNFSGNQWRFGVLFHL